MVRLDRRKLEKLEDKHSKVARNKRVSRENDSLEEYFAILSNAQAEQLGEVPSHWVPEVERSDELTAYFAELEEQEAAREATLRRREQYE